MIFQCVTVIATEWMVQKCPAQVQQILCVTFAVKRGEVLPYDKYVGFYLQMGVNLGEGIMIHPLKPIRTVNSFAEPSPQCCGPCISPYPMNSIRVTESFATCCIISSLQVSHCTGI